jgi:hypothetical protein
MGILKITLSRRLESIVAIHRREGVSGSSRSAEQGGVRVGRSSMRSQLSCTGGRGEGGVVQ